METEEPIIIEIPRGVARGAFILAFIYFIVGPIFFYLGGA